MHTGYESVHLGTEYRSWEVMGAAAGYSAGGRNKSAASVLEMMPFRSNISIRSTICRGKCALDLGSSSSAGNGMSEASKLLVSSGLVEVSHLSRTVLFSPFTSEKAMPIPRPARR